jgi:hypothetical protein
VVKDEIMDAEKFPPEDFVGLREVVEIRSGIASASFAATILIQRLLREFIGCPAELHFSARDERGSTFSKSGGENTVEHIDSAVDRFENIERSADSHEVPG